MSQLQINSAVAWAVGIANDPDHGYDQSHRWGPDYDCSSLVISAYQQAGIPVKTNGATYTGNMVSVFLKTGFIDVTADVNLSTGSGLIYGDVVWRKGHTEMCCGSGKLVGASINENGTITGGQEGDQTGNEIRVRSYYNGSWARVLRYPVSGWIAGNRYLSASEQKHNAEIIYSYMSDNGWSINAIAALLGNMEVESTINPGIWESLTTNPTSYYVNKGRWPGFGLCQWTPYQKFSEWAGTGWKTNYDKQLERLLWEMENGEQYYPTTNYPETFKEFSTSTKTAYYLAGAFLYNYERPASPNADDRGNRAEKWLAYLQQYVSTETNPDEHPNSDPDIAYNNADWQGDNRPLTTSEIQHNGKIVWKFFREHGWSRNAICAILANMERLSLVNPYKMEEYYPEAGSFYEDYGRYPAFGLVQWSPFHKFSDWAGDDFRIASYKQLFRILYELENGLQYYPTTAYPETFAEFAVSDKDEYYLAGAFGANYVRFTSQSTYEDLGERAAGWWNLVVEWEKESKLPVWLLFKLKE